MGIKRLRLVFGVCTGTAIATEKLTVITGFCEVESKHLVVVCLSAHNSPCLSLKCCDAYLFCQWLILWKYCLGTHSRARRPKQDIQLSFTQPPESTVTFHHQMAVSYYSENRSAEVSVYLGDLETWSTAASWKFDQQSLRCSFFFGEVMCVNEQWLLRANALLQAPFQHNEAGDAVKSPQRSSHQESRTFNWLA